MERHLSPLSQPPPPPLPSASPMRSIVTTDLRPMYFQWIFSTFNFTVVVILAGCQNVKMVPFDVVASCFNVISNCRRVIIFQKGLEMFRQEQ